MSDALDGIRAKLDRAEEHLNVLDEMIASYFAANPHRVFGEEETKDDGYWYFAVYLEVTDFPPDEVWGPVIGDAVHNLRSALDHLAWGLALPEARAATPRRIEYPIFLDDPANDPEARRLLTSKLKCLRPEAHAIVDGTQPYKTRSRHHPLWLLQTLWNTDKHRVLHTTGFAYMLARDFAPGTDYGFTAWRWGSFRGRFDTENRTQLESGYVSAAHLASANPLQERMDAYENVTFDVSLGYTHTEQRVWTKDEPYGGLPLRQILRRLQRYVTAEVIDPLQPLL